MTTTTSQAIEQRGSSPSQIVAQYRDDFAVLLPSHVKAETFVRIAQGALRRNSDLMKAATNNPASLMSALMTAARLGLEPGTDEFYLVPYKGEVTGITGYQGEIELIYRAGAVSSVVAQAVYSGDSFAYTPGVHERPIHEVDWFSDRGTLLGAYAYGVMADGATSRVIVIGPRDVEEAKRASASSSSPHSPWSKYPEAMYLKTAIHRLAKFVPTSAEYRREQMRVLAEAQRIVEPVESVDTTTGEIVVEIDETADES